MRTQFWHCRFYANKRTLKAVCRKQNISLSSTARRNQVLELLGFCSGLGSAICPSSYLLRYIL